jgi:hypothetical protein
MIAAVGSRPLGLLRGALSEPAAVGWNSAFIVVVRMRPQTPYGPKAHASLIKIENIKNSPIPRLIQYNLLHKKLATQKVAIVGPVKATCVIFADGSFRAGFNGGQRFYPGWV